MNSLVEDVPEGWAKATIADIAQYVQRGKSPKYTKKSKLPVINQKCVRWDEIQTEHLKFVHPEQWPKWAEERFLLDGDILWNSTGTGTIGRAAIFRGLDGWNRAVCDSHVTVVRPVEYLPELLHAWIRSPAIQGLMEEMQSGSTNQVELGKQAVLDTEIPVPPLAEQRRIVAKVEELLAEANAARDRLAKVPAILKRFRQSVLAAACSGRLTEDWRKQQGYTKPPQGVETMDAPDDVVFDLPDGWNWSPLGKVCDLARGRFSVRPRNDPSCYDGPYPFVQIGDLPPEGGNIEEYHQTLNEKGQSVSRSFPEGTVLIAIVGATIGNTGVLTFESYCPDSLVALQATPRAIPEFVDLYLRFRKLIVRQASYASGGQPNINLKTLTPLPVPVPDIKEQEEVLNRVAELFVVLDRIEEHLQDATRKSENTGQTILAKAFRGELVPTEAEMAQAEGRYYEPASVLLERIQAARQEKKKKATHKRTKKR